MPDTAVEDEPALHIGLDAMAPRAAQVLARVAPPESSRSHGLAFLGQWLRHPRRIASIAPSGRELACQMARAVPAKATHVIELGAGTGAITAALLEHGIAADALLAVEMNEVLHTLLRRRFPTIHSTCANACELPDLLPRWPGFTSGAVGAVTSSLGLLNMAAPMQLAITAACFKVLAPDGVFIQYTYRPKPPIHDSVCAALGLEWRHVASAWRNLPPARVYAYRRRA